MPPQAKAKAKVTIAVDEGRETFTAVLVASATGRVIATRHFSHTVARGNRVVYSGGGAYKVRADLARIARQHNLSLE